MNLIKANNNWSCMAVALAMVLDEPVDKIITATGVDPSEVAWPTYPEPYCYRGHNVQEITKAAYKLGHTASFFAVHYRPGDPQIPLARITDTEAVDFITPKVRALLILPTHAVATDGVQIYDPTGIVMQYEPIWVLSRCDAFLLFDNINKPM